jgi:hypothetical protein
MKYAENTQVSSERSRNEIERILTRYGASAFGYGWQNSSATIMFQMNHKQIRFIIHLPDKEQFKKTETGRLRKPTAIHESYEQAVRQQWRALALVVKAKLEAVESGISEFETEFLAHIVLPNNQTVGQFLIPQVNQAYETGNMPKMLPMLNE